MLQSIRDRSQGWLAGVVIFLIITTFALWGIHSYLTDTNSTPDYVASINGVKILPEELNTAYERLRQQQQMQLGADFVPDQKTELQLKQQALSQLIMSQVLAQAATKEGYRITLGEVEGALLAIPAFQINGRFARERFNEMLSSTLYTEKAFLDDLQTSMLINQVRGGFIASAFALPQEIETAINYINQKRDMGYMLINAARFNPTIHITETAARAYYQQHAAAFATNEQVKIDYLELSVPQIVNALHFNEAQLKQFYANNLSNYTAPQRWQISHILIQVSPNASAAQVAAARTTIETIANRLKAGADFAKLAREYSEDKLTAKQGGVLDWFSNGMFDPAIEKAVVDLPMVGSVSNPIKTKYGYEIIKLLATQQPKVQTFPAVRAQVQKALAQQRAEQIFADSNDKLTNLTYANPTTLDVAAKALHLTVKTSAPFDKAGGKDVITANPKVAAAAFSPAVLQGNNSDVIELNSDQLIVLRVKQHMPASLKTFAEVRAEIEQLLKIQAAQQKAQALSQQLLAQLQQGIAGPVLAQKNGLQWQVLRNIGRYNTQAPAAVVNDAFHLSQPTEQGTYAVTTAQLPNSDYAVIQVLAVHAGMLTPVQSGQQRIYREELENTYGQLDYAVYVKEHLKRAKIIIKDKELASIVDKLSQP